MLGEDDVHAPLKHRDYRSGGEDYPGGWRKEDRESGAGGWGGGEARERHQRASSGAVLSGRLADT